MNNELATVNTQTGEVLGQVVVREDERFMYVIENGKHVRKAKFKDYSSIVAESRADKIWLLNLMNGDENSGNGLKDHVGKEIEVADVIFRKYDKINEETGATEYGVLTYLIDPNKEVYVTSSKTVYFAVEEMLRLFGTPNDETWENLILKVGKKKGTNGDIITVQMIG
ncbi:MAG TPA: hypothetical protein VLG50_00475 [Candidatus Saccharimonadales bacterium]|nr:hypothetical protein [Candidatus Saccharimonadales bacterium]